MDMKSKQVDSAYWTMTRSDWNQVNPSHVEQGHEREMDRSDVRSQQRRSRLTCFLALGTCKLEE